MKEETNQNVDRGLISLVVMSIVIGIIIILLVNSGKNKAANTPRTKNGIDTIYTDDSGYIIRFNIDSAFKR